MSDRRGGAAAEEDFGDGSDGDVQAALEARFAARREAAGETPAPDAGEPAADDPATLLRRRPHRARAPEQDDDEEGELEAPARDDEDADPDADPDADEDAGEEAGDADGAPQPVTLERLAKAWDLKDADEVGKAIMIANAEGKLVPLSEAITAFRQPAPERVQYARDMDELGRYREVDTERQRTFQSAMGDLELLVGALLEDYQGEKQPDWKALAEENPTEYSVKKLRYEERKQRLKGALDVVNNAKRQARDREAAKAEELARTEARLLQASNPEWKDTKKFREALDAMGDYLRTTFKYTDAQIGAIYDHRDWLIVQKAMAFDARATKKGALEKRLGNIPRVPTLRPGSQAVDSGTPRVSRDLARAEESAMAKLKKSGSTQDAEAAVLARIHRGRAERSRGRGRA